MRQWKSKVLIAAFVGICFTQAADIIPPGVRRVGSHLACLCGSCRNTVADCTMLECHYSKPSRAKIAEMLATGATDQAIIDSFVKEQGVRALSVPPAEGFNSLLGWMPWLAGGVGLLAIAWFINRHKPKPEASEMPEVDRALVDKYRETIEKDLGDLD
jgi:cytochrome c-type biogenesis protein CcmH/NrfF